MDEENIPNTVFPDDWGQNEFSDGAYNVCDNCLTVLEKSAADAAQDIIRYRQLHIEIKSLKGLIREIEWERKIYLSTAGPRLRYRSYITPAQRARLEQETKDDK